MIIDFKTGKKVYESRQIHSRDFNSFKKELKEWFLLGYDIKILNTSLKYTRFGKRQSFFAELVQKNI